MNSRRRGRAYPRDTPSSSFSRPTSSRKKPQKKKAEADSEEYFALRDGIVNEKTVKGKLFYLVDWEDHPVTGESYAQSWVGQSAHTLRIEETVTDRI